MIIGVCDDDRSWCDTAAGVISGYVEKLGYNVEVTSFNNGDDVLNWQGQPWDVMFMDIELGEEKNGISVAGELNKRFPGCQIVFLTNYLFYAVDIFQTQHTYFVLKEQLEERLPEVFDKIMHQLEQSGKKLIFSASWGRQIIVRLSDMYYLERELRYTTVYTSWGDFQIKEKLDELMGDLPENEFSRCHHSYIIYFPAIREKKKNSYVLENGKEIIISRSYMKQTNEDWMKWALLQMS